MVDPGLEPGFLYSQPGDHVAVPLDGPCRLPSPLAPLRQGSRGTRAAHFTVPAGEHFLNLPSCLATLQEGDPLKVYPQLKGNFPENLKHLKNTMGTLDWKVSRFPHTGSLWFPTLGQGWEKVLYREGGGVRGSHPQGAAAVWPTPTKPQP